MDGQQVKNSNLAFEDGFDGSPPELWRLEAKRTTPFGTKEITHVNWFASKEMADSHAAWINDGRGRIVESIVKRTRWKAASRSKAARRSGSPLTRRQIESVERQH